MKKALIVSTTDSMIWNFLIPHILELEKHGIRVECACSNTGFYFDELKNKYGLVLHEIPFARNPFKAQNVRAFKRLSRLIKENRYDLIYGHEPVGGAMARLAGKANHKYVLYIAHGFHFFEHAPLKHWVLYYSFEWILSFLTDAIVTICQEDYQHAKKLHAKRCYYIPGIGVDFSKFDSINKEEERKKYRSEFDFSCEDFVLITVGELSVRKNQIVVLRAIKNLSNNNIKLILCGEGDQEEFLRKTCKELGIDSQVKFLGFRRDVPKVLCAADLFIFPSLWEGLGLAGIEAMYSGLPIIGSDRQGIKDYVINEKTGLLFCPNDDKLLGKHIERLMEDEEYRKDLSFAGKEFTAKYSIENSIKALNVIYTSEKII